MTPALPAWLLLVAGPLLWFAPNWLRRPLTLFVPAAALVLLFLTPNGDWGTLSFLGRELALVRLDSLSRIFVLIFLIGAFLASLFAFSETDKLKQSTAMTYAGGAVAAVCAGDLISLFIFWEVVSLASLFLILATKAEDTYRAAFRYFIQTALSGLALLSGLLLSPSASFATLDATTLSGGLILLAFGVKAGFPLLHFWLPDVYPRVSPTSTVFLSIFTTKLAIYALLRGFAGTEILLFIGAAMALGAPFFAMAETNLRRILSYALLSQLGFMVAGIGIGTALALNGAVAHAVASVLYQALLFMVAGAHIQHKNLGRGWLGLCLIGSASIAGLPFFVGFATKSLTLEAALNEGYFYLWLALLAANAMAVVHTAVRLPQLLFNFDEMPTKDETPPHTFMAASLAALLCLGLGLYPQVLYAYLPFNAPYSPFDFAHITQQVQLIVFAYLGGFIFMKHRASGSILLDLDWFGRGLPYLLYSELSETIQHTKQVGKRVALWLEQRALYVLHQLFSPKGMFAEAQPTGAMVLWFALFLIAALMLALIV